MGRTIKERLSGGSGVGVVVKGESKEAWEPIEFPFCYLCLVISSPLVS